MQDPTVTTTSQVSRPRRTTAMKIVLAIGPLLMLAGLLVFVWPSAPSDCHGSPVCALDGLAALGKVVFGGFLGFVGLMWTCAAAAAAAVHTGVNDSTRRVE